MPFAVKDVFHRTRVWAQQSDTIRRLRERRYEFFLRACHVQPTDEILDVGAGSGSGLERFNQTNPIVALDINPDRQAPWLKGTNVRVVQGDATELPFPDGAFPVVFSSSVIQYVPYARRERYASEIRRVGARYFVQAPNRRFPIDPHYQLPLIQFLPARTRRWLSRRLALGFRPIGDEAFLEMPTASELARLFPEARIHRERVFGLTKSFMVVGRGINAR